MASRAFPIETPERLAVRGEPNPGGTIVVREIGHFGYVIHQYVIRPEDPHDPWRKHSVEKDDVGFLIQQLIELERRCQEMAKANPVSIDLPRWKWNRRAARRRLRRWVHEHGEGALMVPPEHYGLLRQVLDEQYEPHDELEDTVEWADRGLGHHAEYEPRRRERVVVPVKELPDPLGMLLAEANEAYFHGLFRPAVALSRTVLGDVLRRVVQAKRTSVGPVPIRGDRLEVLINCVPTELLGAPAKRAAHEIRKRGNDAVHDPDVKFDERGTWRTLVLTGKIVEMLINRGGIEEEHS